MTPVLPGQRRRSQWGVVWVVQRVRPDGRVMLLSEGGWFSRSMTTAKWLSMEEVTNG